MTEKTSIFEKSADELRAEIGSWGESPYRAEQLILWFFKHRVFDPDRYSNLSKKFLEKLKETYDFSLPKIITRLNSPDGASKLLIADGSGKSYEAVIIRYPNRVSLCVSSQVGCKLACKFCQTGKLGFFRNLSTREIVAQFALANDIVSREGRNITNIVFMGMGEPLENFDAVMKAVKMFNVDFGISRHKVTVSTSGIVPKIYELSKTNHASLALSLHACRDDLRTALMPINQRYPLKDLRASLFHYQRNCDEFITIEYILIKDLNSSLREAKELVKFVNNLKVKINLIPFNAHPGLPYQRPSDEEIRAFQEYLSSRGFVSPVRYSRGLAVSAACGQLAAKSIENLAEAPLRRNIIVEKVQPAAVAEMAPLAT